MTVYAIKFFGCTMWHWTVEEAQIWSVLFSGASLVVTTLGLIGAVGAVIVAYLQMHSSKKSQREATAQSAYQQYLQLCFEHPTLANGDLQQIKKAEQNEKYEWFVSLLLNASEQILHSVPDDEAWMNTIKSQFEYHAEYLSSDVFKEYLAHYDENLQTLIAAATALQTRKRQANANTRGS